MPFYFPPGTDIPSDWNMVTPKENNVPKPGKRYVCPPTSRFMGKYPYDALCSTTAKRCKATKDTKYNIPNADDYCEILYRKNDYNDTKCNSGFS